MPISSRAAAVQSQIQQLEQELQTQERSLSQCLVELAERPGDDDLRKEREETSARAARLRGELADMTRARAHAERLDAGLERDSMLDTCALRASESKELAQKRVKIAEELVGLIASLTEKKRAYDEVDGKQSINHALARDVGTDRRRTAYAPPSSRFQGSSAS